jgi:hypothetical protein
MNSFPLDIWALLFDAENVSPFDLQFLLSPGDDIFRKPVPKWPHRRSWRAQVKAARRRRNIAKRGGAR